MQDWKQSKPMKTIRKGGRKRYRKPFQANAPRFISRPPGKNLQTFDVVGTGITASTTGSLTLLHVPTRSGSNYIDRYGDSTTIKSLRFQYTIYSGSLQTFATTNLYQTVRVCVFWDEQPNGAVPGGALPFLALTPLSNTEPQFSYRFKLLRDERHVITGLQTADKPAMNDIYLRNLALVSNFNQNNGVIGDINTGALYVYIIGDTAAGANFNPVVNFTSRTRFES